MKTTLRLILAASCCASLSASARAAFIDRGPLSLHPESMPEAAVPTPTISAGIEAALPSAAVPGAAAPSAAQAPEAFGGLERAATPAGFDQAGGPSVEAMSLTGDRTFDGARALPQSDDLDGQSDWYDQHTGQYETQQTKVRKAYQLAMSHPLASAIKNHMPQNTVYKVDNTEFGINYVARTFGDDPERQGEPAMIVFTNNALRDLSPEFLAAKIAGLWARHLYRDKMAPSAEKTYVEGSVMIRVFMGLTGSEGQSYWNYQKDHKTRNSVGDETFTIFSHWFHWSKGFDYDNVRQGPYFLNKIMRAEGDPWIDADARGRMTLHQREQAGQISGDQATNGQKVFDGFVSNER